MLWLARFISPIITRPRAALFLTLIAAVACADRDATAPQRTAPQRASADIIPSPFDDLWVAPHLVRAGDTATGTITLAAPAPAGGAHIVIKSTNIYVASLDTNLVVPEGATSKTFTVHTYPTPIDIGIDLYADWGTSRITTMFIVKYVAPPPPPPSISVSPGSLTFASQAVGTSSGSQVVTVRNTGTAILKLGALAPMVVNGPFAQTNNCPGTLMPNTFCNVWVVYTATGAGPQSGSLVIPSNAPSSPSIVYLNGTGFVPAPAISITPASIGFGGVPLGAATSGRVVKITSTGSAPLYVSSLTLGGTNPGDFSIAVDGCTGVLLNPGASCTAHVSFEPARVGTRTATLTIAHNAAGGPAVVSLSGAGVKGAGGYIP